MKLRKFRIAFSIACSAFCLLVLVLWIRNFWRADIMWTPLPRGGQLTAASTDGQIECSVLYPRTRFPSMSRPTTWGWQSYTPTNDNAVKFFVPWKTVIRGGASRIGNLWLTLPHWFLVVCSILLAVAPWIRWSRQFTIRTMLIITALVAMVLALAVTASG